MSSTYVDLVEERREVIQALLELDCIPAGMEMFPAANDEQWELIRTVIDTSDYYVVIVGGRYGSTTAEGVSFTEKEYDYAVASGIPVLGFMHAQPTEIPAGKSELDSSARERLEAFREKVRSRMTKEYTDPASLGSVVSRSIVAAMKRNPRPGWVRGEFAMSAETRAEIAELRAQIAERDRAAAISTHDPGLAHADDEVEIDYTYSSNYWGESRTWAGTWAPTWDDVLRAIGPLILDEATESAMRERLQSAALEDLWDTDEWPKVAQPKILISDASWGSVVVQLRALAYIEAGTKKRTASDRSTYWRLTTAGDAHLVSLLAARRDDGATSGTA